MRSQPDRAFGWIATSLLLVGILGFAAVYAENALGEYDPSRLPGDDPEYLQYVWLLLLAGGLVLVLAATTRLTAAAMATPLLPFVSLAATSLAAARYFSYDDYAYPSLVRVGSVATVSGWWLVALAAGALVAALVAWRRPRAGLVVQGGFLWVILVWTFVLGPWH